MPAYAYTMTIDRELREKYHGNERVSLDDLTLPEAINVLNTILNSLPESVIRTEIEISGETEYSDPDFIVNSWRMETEAERDERVRKAEQYNATVEERRRQQYLEMKREFEPE